MYQSITKPIVNADCPYFLREYKRTITCEGLIDGSTNTIKFDQEEDKASYIKEHCFCYPNTCHIACALDNKYSFEQGKK